MYLGSGLGSGLGLVLALGVGLVVRLEEPLTLDTAVSPTPTLTPNRLGRVTLDRSERELEGKLGQPVGQLRWAWLGLGLGYRVGGWGVGRGEG